MSDLIREEMLENGLKACFVDSSNRYFGDFHRVVVDVRIEVPLEAVVLSEEQSRAVTRLKGGLCFERRLERMGVETSQVDAVRNGLVEDFLAASGDYLSRPDFPSLLLKKKLAERPRLKLMRG